MHRLLGSLLVLTACGAPAAAPAPPPAAAPRSLPACAREVAGLGDLVAPGATLFLGEIHGTAESLAFLGDVACAAWRRGPTTVALEIPGTEQPRIDAFLSSAGSEADRIALLAGAFWRRPQQDGRSSAAMLGLLDRLRGERASGADVAVFAYDVETDAKLDGQTRDRTMAEHLISARRGAPRRTFIAHGGNVHSRHRVGVPWDPNYQPMGWFVAEAGIALTTLDVRRDGGAAWTCQQPDPNAAMQCGVSERPGKVSDRTWYVELGATDTGHDGFYIVGPTKASPPAAPQPAAPAP